LLYYCCQMCEHYSTKWNMNKPIFVLVERAFGYVSE
jgi:hypothetical protein